MKAFLFTAILAAFSVQSAMAAGKPAECRAVRVLDDTVFEEGLSVDEYPDTYVNKYKGQVILHIGGHWFGDSPGEKIETRRASNGDVITGSYSKDRVVLIIQSAESRYTRAKLVVKDGKEKFKVVALLRCKAI